MVRVIHAVELYLTLQTALSIDSGPVSKFGAPVETIISGTEQETSLLHGEDYVINLSILLTAGLKAHHPGGAVDYLINNLGENHALYHYVYSLFQRSCSTRTARGH